MKETSTICGLPSFVGIARNDMTVHINNILLAVVNGPCAIFASVSNLAVIVAVVLVMIMIMMMMMMMMIIIISNDININNIFN